MVGSFEAEGELKTRNGKELWISRCTEAAEEAARESLKGWNGGFVEDDGLCMPQWRLIVYVLLEL